MHKRRCQSSINRSLDFLEQYEKGSTLVEIGRKHGLTRERVRQIIKDAVDLKLEEEKKSNLEVEHHYNTSTPVERLLLPERALNALINNNLCFIEQLLLITPSEISKLGGMGKKSLFAIEEKMTLYAQENKISSGPFMQFINERGLKSLCDLDNGKIKDYLSDVKNKHQKNKFQNKKGGLELNAEELMKLASNCSTAIEFFKKSGMNINQIKKYFPNVMTVLHQKSKRWSRFYLQCLKCGTITVPHRSYGYCEICFPKTDHYKMLQKASRFKNLEKRKDHEKEYLKEYYKRPEIIQRKKEHWDDLKYNGNREKAISRDRGRCTKCGTEREQSYKLYKRDLYVRHIDNNMNNNDINNLTTLCHKCFKKKL